MRPGVDVLSVESTVPRSQPTETDPWFIAGHTQKGPIDRAIEIATMGQYTETFGAKESHSPMWDVTDVFFREGGGKLVVARVPGPTPVTASLNLAGTGTTLIVAASSVGDWANGATSGLTAEVIQGPIGGSNYRVIIIRLNGIEVERTPEFDVNGRQTVADWSLSSDYVRITLGGGSGLPTVAAAANLAGGTDDHANATDTQRAAALGLFTASFGPGQVSIPGATTSSTHGVVLTHAATLDRTAILDAPNSTVKATLLAATTALRTHVSARVGGMFAPWVTVPGTAVGTTRVVPPSALVAARIARVDALAGVNQPAAGDYGVLDYALGVGASFNATDREDLNNGSVNLIIEEFGQVKIYGWRTLVDKDTTPNWWMLSNRRLEMQIKALSRVIGSRFVFRRNDGLGHTLGAFEGELIGMLNRLYLAGELSPDPKDIRPETAFRVTVDEDPDVLADGRLEADVAVRMAPFAEMVVIRVAKTPITSPV